ncbi:Arginine metabolism regulation protein II [Candida viswanathii]|uniref:Arginine metabolism regulation protein II n=1 Tax=Candida viswanathii TaxID=5486 RepID=A0A367Y4Y3_9ASCO|nr:Arginine metabolism regulation protein II [Candida viswanathii]
MPTSPPTTSTTTTPPLPTPVTSSSSRIKRSKTFTGCFTCRSRKIKCDLTRPHCEKCVKAGLLCAGYDIKLRWSMPIKYKPTKSGNVKSEPIRFNDKEDGESSSSSNALEFFQRRLVGFVSWEEPYETYEDMDLDLAVLHGLGDDPKVKLRGVTKTRGPFGVFRGDGQIVEIEDAQGQQQQQQQGQGQPKRKKQRLGGRDNGLLRGESYSNNTSTTPSIVANSPVNNATPASTSHPSASVAPHDHFWLSNELKDAALVTAAALDTQFLDMMYNFNSSNVPAQSNNSNANHASIDDFNNPDFLNLLFHRHQHPELTVGAETPQSTHSSTNNNMSMTNLLNQGAQGNANVIMDQTYYSNFSNFFYNNPYQSNDNLEIQLHAKGTDNDYVDGDQTNDKKLLEFIMSIMKNPINVSFDLSLPNRDSQIRIPVNALQVQPLTRYLLNYYITEVADLMTVIPLTENPWKAIYFPRALMAIGELLALGKTSTAKNALLNALLAVLAFNLQSKFPKNSEAMRFYLNLGIALRNQASLFIKQLLHNKNSSNGIEYCITHEKYKDVLCAVMSMISVDLVWGTMQDTGVYIAWCGKVIVAKMKNKKKLSSKARILHRIFLSLKLIQDSTCLDLESIKEDFETNIAHSGYDVNGDKFGNNGKRPLLLLLLQLEEDKESDSKARIDFIVNNTFSNDRRTSSSASGKSTTSPSFVNKKLINTMKNDENFATDALYGLPNSLILLFSETVELLRTRIYHKEMKKPNPVDFDKRVDALEKDLLNWKLDWELFEKEDNSQSDIDDYSKKKFYSPMHQATYHHILSFYHALVIYYNRLIRDVHPRELQDKVSKTLDHLNSIQKLISKNEASIIPLFWQGFIAGCEALSPELQLEFKKWGADIAQYLGSYWGARQIMLEVWRRKRMNESNDDWISVIHDWEMNLMLD